jgi:hypothetical protein
MQRESDSARVPLDVEIERLCEVLVNAAADWWARRATEEEVVRVWISEDAGLETRSGEVRTERTA